jgi:aerobic-type carbon monoxide dehydrogenase small subunit (CoxS/CutS family)
MAEDKEKDSRKISRREFLRNAGIIVGGAAIGSTMILAACAPSGGTTSTVTTTKTVTTTAGTQTITVTAPPVTKTITVTPTTPPPAAANVVNFTLNGYPYSMAVDPGWTLQYLLHDMMGRTSIKDMCFGYGACGSCSAIINGRPVLTCMTLAIEMNGAEIETADGIADAGHPLIDAYILNNCMQCGYCTPGFLVTAKALLDRNPKPAEADIREALGGNICRCGTYPRHILAVLEASGQAAA